MESDASDERLTQFLLALAERMPSPVPPESVGKSLSDIFSEEGFCDVNDIRCVCGISVPSDEPMIRCCQCGQQLHMRCLELPMDSEPAQRICPFCRVKVHNIDPFRDFEDWLRVVDDSAKDISMDYDKLSQLATNYKYALMRDPQQRNEAADKANAVSVTEVYNQLIDTRKSFAELID